MSTFFHTHAHSKFSVLDGMPEVQDMVAKVVANGQPALALTDHGNMAGSVQLYKHSKKAGIVPFPGEEFYIVSDVANTDAQRYHIGMLALDYQGYQALVRLSSRSHTIGRFYRKPLIDFSDLKAMYESGDSRHVVLLTGCYFGLVAQALVQDNGKPARATKIVKTLAGWFPHTYVELQHHNTPNGTNDLPDDKLVRALSAIADNCGLPVIITQDSHYCDLADQADHDMMKRVGYYGASSKSDGTEADWTFPGDGYHLARTEWVHDHYEGFEREWRQSLISYKELLELNELRIPVLDDYKYHIPQVHKTPQAAISRRCYTTLDLLMDFDIVPKSKRTKYLSQLKYELGVIDQLGFGSYFVLGAMIVDYCKDHNIRISARGSASGSLVCWLLGVTQLDPIKWDLKFERFLSLDRTRPPDIDFDIDKFRRDEVIQWLASQFSVMPIGTYGTLGQDEETGKGSMFVLWAQYERNRLGKEEFNRKWGHVKGMADLPRTLQKKLYRLADHAPLKHAATHAAGLVVTDDEYPLTDLCPFMLVGGQKGHNVTQMTMDDVEDLGFVKIDLLGLRAEFTLGRTLELLGYSPIDELHWVPLNDSKTFTVMRKGDTGTGIFTFEGYTQAKGCKEVRVKSLEDLTLVNAIYRPATMNSGYVREYLKRKSGEHKVEYLDGPGGLFEKAFGSTYGVPVYQEQVMDLLRLLGFPTAELNAMLKAIKASNKKIEKAAKTFDETEERFIDLCCKAGMDRDTAYEAWEAIKQFSDYSFNRGHAAEYAVRGYWNAYFKVNYPLEFHTALLEGVAMSGGDTQKKLEPQYVREARRYGLRILPADVSVSNEYWTMDKKRGGIRRGLTSIKGIAAATAEAIVAARPFTTVEEMLDGAKAASGRALSGGKDYMDSGNYSGVVLALREAGALRSLGIEPEGRE